MRIKNLKKKRKQEIEIEYVKYVKRRYVKPVIDSNPILY